MNCDVTVTADEFTKIHNALCEFRSLQNLFDGMLHPAMTAKFNRAMVDISDGLKGAYEQDEHASVAKSTHYENVQEDLGLKSIWSMYEVDNLNAPHPFEGAQEVLYRNHWGPKPVHVAVNGLTWAALYVAADAAIRDSGDEHHVFIEQFKQSGNTLILSTGS